MDFVEIEATSEHPSYDRVTLLKAIGKAFARDLEGMELPPTSYGALKSLQLVTLPLAQKLQSQPHLSAKSILTLRKMLNLPKVTEGDVQEIVKLIGSRRSTSQQPIPRYKAPASPKLLDDTLPQRSMSARVLSVAFSSAGVKSRLLTVASHLRKLERVGADIGTDPTRLSSTQVENTLQKELPLLTSAIQRLKTLFAHENSAPTRSLESVRKGAFILQTQKRLRLVAKRIVLLTYLRNKS